MEFDVSASSLNPLRQRKKWWLLNFAGEREFLREELTYEVEANPNHLLHEQRVTFCLRWSESPLKDFVVYAVPVRKYVSVHLTWAREARPQWPWTVVIGDKQELMNEFFVSEPPREWSQRCDYQQLLRWNQR